MSLAGLATNWHSMWHGDRRMRGVVLTSIWSAAGRVSSTIATLISIPFAVSGLGREQFGIWNAITAFFCLFTFMDGGMSNAVINLAAAGAAKNDDHFLKRLASTTYFVLSVLAIVGIVAISLLFVIADPNWFIRTNGQVSNTELMWALIVTGILFFSNIPLSLAARFHRAFQNGHIPSAIEVVSNIVTILASIAAWYLGFGLLGFLIAYSMGTWLGYLLNTIVLMRQDARTFMPRIQFVSGDIAKELFSTGFLFLVLQLCAAISFQIDVLIISNIHGPGVAGEYGLASRLFLISSSLTSMFTAPLWPAFRDAVVRGDEQWVSSVFKKTLLITIGFGLCFSVPVLIFHRFLLQVWTHSAAPPLSAVIGLFIWANLAGVGNLLASLLNGMAKIRIQIILSTTLAVFNLFLSIILTYQIGVAGAVWGSIISYLLCILIPYAMLIPKYLRSISLQPNCTTA